MFTAVAGMNRCIFLAESDDLDPDVARVASLGFTGCLSVVRFNSISPLKAALLHPHTSPVVVSGPLVRSSCGATAPADPSAAEDPQHLPGRSRSRRLQVSELLLAARALQALSLMLNVPGTAGAVGEAPE